MGNVVLILSFCFIYLFDVTGSSAFSPSCSQRRLGMYAKWVCSPTRPFTYVDVMCKSCSLIDTPLWLHLKNLREKRD